MGSLLEGRGVIARVLVVLLALIGAFEAGLAFGAPWGRGAWGGEHLGKLPVDLRWASAGSALFYILLILVVLARPARWRSVVLVLAALITGASTLANILSESRIENLVWTPIALVVTVLLVLVRRDPTAARKHRRGSVTRASV